MTLHELLAYVGIDSPKDGSLDRWAARLSERPFQNLLSLIGASTLLFFRAEKGHNPKVNDVWDALIYCATSVSVGYADIFPRTPVGKIIGASLMTIGPSMAAKAMEGRAYDRGENAQYEIVSTLKEILAELRSQRPAPQE